MMNQYKDFTKNRSDPGILLLNKKKQVIFANQIALKLIDEGKKAAPNSKTHRFPPFLSEFYDQMKERSDMFAPNSCIDSVFFKRLARCGNTDLELKGFTIAESAMSDSTSFLILIRTLKVRSGINIRERCDLFHLTPKQLKVTLLLATGLTNKEIANELKISETTVKDHIRKIMEKIRVTTRAGIVSKFLSCSDHQILGNRNKKNTS